MVASRFTRLIPNLIALLMAVVMMGCGPRHPDEIKIGFLGGLTGRNADLGISGRDGALLAIEQINEAGGIDGHPLRLIVKDDQQSEEVARRVTRELVDEGVQVIIGAMTSTMSKAALEVAEPAGVLMISPTTSTNELTGLDDHFLRVMPPSVENARALATELCDRMQAQRVAVIYDERNRSYSVNHFEHIGESLRECGGDFVVVETFESGPDAVFLPLVERLVAADPDALVIITGAMDAGMISQQVRKLTSDLPIVICEWASTRELLEFGGSAVEGVVFYNTVDRNSRAARHLAFRAAYRDRFGTEPGFAAVHAHNVMLVIAEGLRQNPDRASLRETILEIGTFEGLQTSFTFDEFGDPETERFRFVVRDGDFRVAD